MCKMTMRIHRTDRRERRWQNLKKATSESTVSGALDVAADHYLRMAGSEAYPSGAIPKLLREAEARGLLTGEEIAEILDHRTLEVSYETSWSVGSK